MPVAFFCLIMTASYCASLTKFCIIKSAPDASTEDVNDVRSNSLALLTPKGRASAKNLKKEHNRLKALETEAEDGGDAETEKRVMRATSEEECGIGLALVEAFNTCENEDKHNVGCEFARVGDEMNRVLISEAGLAIADSKKCFSSLLESALDFHLVAVNKDGVVDQNHEEHRSEASVGWSK